MTTNRNANLDLVIVIMQLFVVALHTIKPFSFPEPFFHMFLLFLLQCNSMFFIRSGYLNLGKQLNGIKEYRIYYYKLFERIVIPFVVCLVFLSLDDARGGHIKGRLIWIFKSFWGFHEQETHLWFIYYLLPLLIVAPFLSIMLNKMSKTELHLLFLVTVIIQNIKLYFTVIPNGINSEYSLTIIDGYYLFFFLGYYFKRYPDAYRSVNQWIAGLAAVVGFIMSGLQYTYLENYDYTTNVFWVLFVIFAWDILSIRIQIPDICKKTLLFFSKYAFVSYMIHLKAVDLIEKITAGTTVSNAYVLKVFIAFVVSTIMACILTEFVIKTFQLFLRKTLIRLGC